MNPLIETNGLAHRRLKVEGFDVLPILLEEGDEEVDGYARVIRMGTTPMTKEKSYPT